MNPDSNQNSGNSGQLPQPTPQPASQQPTYGAGAGTPQQTYETLPPPSVTGRSTGHNPYEFIVNPNTPKPKAGLMGDKFLRKILFIILGVAVLFAVLAVLATALIPNKNAVPALADVAQEQQEIIRVANTANFASQQSTQNAAANVVAATVSSQNYTLSYLASHGKKLNTKGLTLAHDSKTDSILAAAKSTNTYDTALLQVLTDDLQTYQQKLRTAFNAATSTKLRTNLQQTYVGSQLLLSQVKATDTPQDQ